MLAQTGSAARSVVYTTLAGIVEMTWSDIQAVNAIGRPLEATARYI
jgi:hypothetical protein